MNIASQVFSDTIQNCISSNSTHLKCAQLKGLLYTRLFYSIGNGYISTDVLKEILQELDAKLTNEDLDNIIEEVDEDGSGTLGTVVVT